MTRTEHLVFLTNEAGDQARTALLRVMGSKRDALAVAKKRGLRNFNVIERADSEHGYSDQRVATVRNGSAA